MRWLRLLAAVLMLSGFNLYWRWPANTGAAHWSEWLMFYGSPPISFALIWLACAVLVRRLQMRRGIDPGRLSVVKPWVFALVMIAPGWMPAANTGPRRFVLTLLALT